MATKYERGEFIHLIMKYATLKKNQTEHDLQREAVKILRYATTHVRIETELTNGYKDRFNNWDEARTTASKAKRDWIDNKMEQAAKSIGITVQYGSLTVSVRFSDGREVYVP